MFEAENSSAVAALASALVPGTGQVYNGQIAKGISLILLAGLSVVLMVTGIGVLLYLIVWEYAIYDAYKMGVTLIRLPEGVAFWRGLMIAIPGVFLFLLGAVFELFLLGGRPPEWAFNVVIVGGLLMVVGPGWYWIVRPLSQ